MTKKSKGILKLHAYYTCIVGSLHLPSFNKKPLHSQHLHVHHISQLKRIRPELQVLKAYKSTSRRPSKVKGRIHGAGADGALLRRRRKRRVTRKLVRGDASQDQS